METAFTHSLLMEGAAAAAISQLDSVARQQVTWRSLATTPLQKPDNPLNLSLPPSPHTSIFLFSVPFWLFVCKIASNVAGLLHIFMAISHN